MTEVQQTTTLRDLTRDQASYGTPRSVDGHDVVVLGYGTDGWIEVCRDSGISSYEPGTAVGPLTDPARQAAALRSALAAVATRQTVTLAGIRSYVIERYQDGSICHEGLNAFLRAFDLEEYEG
jgi:hypothetical protein